MKKLIIILSFLIPLGILAQEQEKEVTDKEFKLGEYAPMYVSYYGNFVTHPGIKLGFDWNLLMIEKTKAKKKRIKTIKKILLVTPSITYYSHKASHKGLIISTDLAWRRYSEKLFFREVSLGAGYFRKFNSGETWETNDDGTVSNIGSTSRGYFAPSISFAFGKRFIIKKGMPISVFTKLNTNVLTGYDASAVAELSLELGARMTLDWGINRGEIRTITKSK
ncbi:MAG: hypothetical protein KAR19_01925 [Bacteroidales bacterium]|nr:hypothetical protein [Bacteroidales bacterium]